MYQEKKLERRRRDYLRMKERARHVQARWWDTHHTDPDLHDAASKLANTLKLCSCSLCGNPRRDNVYGDTLTMQELKALDDSKDQLKCFLEETLDI